MVTGFVLSLSALVVLFVVIVIWCIKHFNYKRKLQAVKLSHRDAACFAAGKAFATDKKVPIDIVLSTYDHVLPEKFVTLLKNKRFDIDIV